MHKGFTKISFPGMWANSTAGPQTEILSRAIRWHLPGTAGKFDGRSFGALQ